MSILSEISQREYVRQRRNSKKNFKNCLLNSLKQNKWQSNEQPNERKSNEGPAEQKGGGERKKHLCYETSFENQNI